MNKHSFKRVLAFAAIVLALLVLPFVAASPQTAEMLHITGANTYIVGGYGDNFVYDGVGYQKTDGFITMDVSDETNTGLLVATWEATDYYGYSGTFLVVMDTFMGMMPWMDGGIATNLTVHGATERGPPALPEVYTYVGGWGEADVYVNGTLVFEDMDAHFMVTEGTRDPVTHMVYNADKTGPYSPMNPTNATTYPELVLTHIMLHSLDEDLNNFPTWTVAMHINYESTATFGITPGPPGPLGSQGPQGETGPQGPQGEPGSAVPVELTYGAIVLAIVAIIIGIYSLFRKP